MQILWEICSSLIAVLLEYSRFKIELGLHERRFAKSGLPGKNSLALFVCGIIYCQEIPY